MLLPANVIVFKSPIILEYFSCQNLGPKLLLLVSSCSPVAHQLVLAELTEPLL